MKEEETMTQQGEFYHALAATGSHDLYSKFYGK